MTREELERLNDQGLAAWDAHDADAFLSLFADDFVWHDWTLPQPIRDKEAARAYFGTWMTAFPDLKTTKVDNVIGDDELCSEIEWTGTNSGPMSMGENQIPPTHRYVTGRGVYIARLRDGKIVEFRSHPDVAGLMMQLGLIQG